MIPRLSKAQKRFNRIGVNFATDVFAARVRHRFVANAATDVVVVLVVIGRDQFDAVADDLADESGQRASLRVSDDSADHVALALNSTNHADLEVTLSSSRQALLAALLLK